jgi:diguanylate cyclase
MLIDIAFATIVATAGIAGGWFLRGGNIRRELARSEAERQVNREVLGRLYEVAGHVAQNVHEHSLRVEEIHDRLPPTGEVESTQVVSAVTQLIEANQQMKDQLDAAQEKLQQQTRLIECHAAEARTDALTGLANRRAFDEEIARRLAEFRRQGRIVSLALIDVDHFKQFNDRHGHAAGDRVLRGLASVFQQQVRDMDLVARFGGEEFAIILPGTLTNGALIAAERIRAAVETANFQYGDLSLRVTVSMGVAQFLEGDDERALVERSDTALYAAKDSGRNAVYWHDGTIARPAHESSEPLADADPESAPVTCIDSEPDAEQAAATVAEDSETESDDSPDREGFLAQVAEALNAHRTTREPLSLLLVRADQYEATVRQYGDSGRRLVTLITRQFVETAVAEFGLIGDYDTGVLGLLLPAVELSEAAILAQRIGEAISRCDFPLGSARLHFTLSIGGTAAMPSDNVERFVARAKTKLGEAASVGDQVCCGELQAPPARATAPGACEEPVLA